MVSLNCFVDSCKIVLFKSLYTQIDVKPYTKKKENTDCHQRILHMKFCSIYPSYFRKFHTCTSFIHHLFRLNWIHTSRYWKSAKSDEQQTKRKNGRYCTHSIYIDMPHAFTYKGSSAQQGR